jgi:hypothetical protein
MGDFIMHLSASEKADKCMMKSSKIGYSPAFQSPAPLLLQLQKKLQLQL